MKWIKHYIPMIVASIMIIICFSSITAAAAQNDSNFIAVAAGGKHSLALKSDGTVIAWGDNTFRQSDVPKDLKEVKAIAAGFYHSAALKEDGSLVLWGDNTYGECTVPKELTGVRIKAIAAGLDYTVAVKEDGTVAMWGYNSEGQCNVPQGLKDVKSIAAGYDFVIALKADGTLTAWGNDAHGKCSIPQGLSMVKKIAAGGWHAAALKEDGSVVQWGDNAFGMCKQHQSLQGVKDIVTGRFYTAAVKHDSSIVYWGSGWSKDDCINGVKEIAAGNGHIVALKEDGTVAALGKNYDGQCDIPAEKKLNCSEYTKDDILIRVDGRIYPFAQDKPYINAQGIIMAPLMPLADAIIARADWDLSKNTVKLEKNTRITMTIGTKTALIDAFEGVHAGKPPQKKMMNAAPVLIGSNVYVPLDFICDSFSVGAKWEEGTKTVELSVLPDSHIFSVLSKDPVIAMRSDFFRKQMVFYTDDAKEAGFYSLGFLLADTDSVDNGKLKYHSLQVKSRDDKTMYALKCIIKEFFPKSGDAVLKEIQDSFSSGTEVKGRYDGREFRCHGYTGEISIANRIQ